MYKVLKTNLCNLIFFEAFSTSYIHGNRISGKFYIQAGIKIVYRFDQADAADLEQIVHIFIAGGETLDDAEYQAEIPFNVFFPGFLVSVFDPGKERLLFCRLEKRQLGGVHTADFHFSLCHMHTMPFCRNDSNSSAIICMTGKSCLHEFAYFTGYEQQSAFLLRKGLCW